MFGSILDILKTLAGRAPSQPKPNVTLKNIPGYPDYEGPEDLAREFLRDYVYPSHTESLRKAKEKLQAAERGLWPSVKKIWRRPE
jgi:hypothetical protein